MGQFFCEFWLFSSENLPKLANCSANIDFFPAKIPRNRPIFLRICPWKSRDILVFFPRNIRSPVYMTVGSLYIGLMVHCVVPKGIHTSPTEGIFLRPPTPVEIPVKLHTFTEIFGPLRTPPPPPPCGKHLAFAPPPPPPPPPSRNFQSLLLGGVWIFSGATHCSLVIVRITFLFLHRLPYCCLCKVMHRKGTLLELCKCCSPYSALYQKVIIKILRLLGLHIAKVLK